MKTGVALLCLIATNCVNLSLATALGIQKWAVVLLDYCESSQNGLCDERESVDYMRNVLETRDNSVVKYFDAASYGKFHIDMDFFGWIRPETPLQQSVNGYAACYPLDQDRFQLILNEDDSVNLHDYEGFLFIVRRPKNVRCAAGTANGFASLDRNTYTNQGVINSRIALAGATIHPDNFSGITSSTIAHEILHTYGLQHVGAIDCEDDQVVDINGEDCSNQGYGGLFSIMGLRSFASLPSPVNLDNLSWITPYEDLQIVRSSGEYTIYPLENENSPIKALRIDIDNPIPLFEGSNPLYMDRIYIHYRGFTGLFDDHFTYDRVPLEDGTYWSPPSNLEGAIVHAADCSEPVCRAMLLDMNPSHNLFGSDAAPSYGPNRVADALLYEGNYRDLIRIGIETTQVNPGESITVRIDLDGMSTPELPPEQPTGFPSSILSGIPSEMPSEILSEDPCPLTALGTHRWAAVLLDYCGTGVAGCDPRRSRDEMEDLLVNRDNSVVNYLDTASYGNFHIEMDVFDWIQPEVPLRADTIGYAACYPLDQDRFRYPVNSYDADSFNLEDYDGFLFIVRRPSFIRCAAGTANGFGPQPRRTYTEPAEICTRVALAGATIYPDNFSGITSSTIVHEILHTYGLQHVGAIDCEDDQVIDINGEDCSNQGYGGLFSIMGLRSFASLPSPVNLDNLSWITPDDGLQIATSSGEYTIYPLEDKNSPVKALRIDIDDPIPLFEGSNPLYMDRIYIHYRGFTGLFDDHFTYDRVPLEDGTYWSPPSNLEGVIVHAADCSEPVCRAMLLDMNPSHNLFGSDAGPSYGPNRVADALLYEGNYRDLIRFGIETTRVNPGESVTVRIEFGGTPRQRPPEVPSPMPSGTPSTMPSTMPSRTPSAMPSGIPTSMPSGAPSGAPSGTPSEMPSEVPSAVPCPTSAMGTHRWAAILLDYCGANDDGCDPLRSRDEMEDLLVTRQNSVVNYLDTASYGNFHIEMDVFDWIQPEVPLRANTLGYAACYPLDQDRFRYPVNNHDDFDLEGYDGFLFIVRRPTSIRCAAGTANGFGPSNRFTYTEPAEICTRVALAGATIYPDNYSGITSSTIVHEILHTYGLQHVGAVNCEDNEVVDINGEDCTNQGYGGLFSIMGLRSFASLPSPVNLDNLSWITAGDDLQIVRSSGEYTIYPLENNNSPVKALRIDIDNPIPLFEGSNPLYMDRIYIHYRGFTGLFDDHFTYDRVYLEDGTYWSRPMMDGALVHAADCSSYPPICRGLLLDMNPTHELRGSDASPNYGPHRVADALLYEGQYRDLVRVGIETVSVVPGQSITVRVELHDAPASVP